MGDPFEKALSNIKQPKPQPHIGIAHHAKPCSHLPFSTILHKNSRSAWLGRALLGWSTSLFWGLGWFGVHLP